MFGTLGAVGGGGGVVGSGIDLAATFDAYVVTEYGVSSSSSSDQTAEIHSVRDTAGVGGILIFPPGTYYGIDLAPLENQTWHLCDGATLKLPDGAAAGYHVIYNTNDGVTIQGESRKRSIVDGNRANWLTSTDYHNGIRLLGENNVAKNLRVQNCAEGIDGAENGFEVRSCDVVYCRTFGIHFKHSTPNSSVRYRLIIDDNYVDNTGEDRTNYQTRGIRIEADPANSRYAEYCRVTNNIVQFPIHDQAHTNSNPIPMELWQGPRGLIVSGNILIGGQYSMSLDNNIACTVSNNVMSQFEGYGIEIVNTAAEAMTITGNICYSDTNPDWGSIRTVGIAINRCSHISVVNNVVRGCQTGVFLAGTATPLLYITIDGLHIYDAATRGFHIALSTGDGAHWNFKNITMENCALVWQRTGGDIFHFNYENWNLINCTDFTCDWNFHNYGDIHGFKFRDVGATTGFAPSTKNDYCMIFYSSSIDVRCYDNAAYGFNHSSSRLLHAGSGTPGVKIWNNHATDMPTPVSDVTGAWAEYGAVPVNVKTGITATTSVTQGGGPLYYAVNEWSTCAAGAGGTAPPAFEGSYFEIINNGANDGTLYPTSGDNLGAGVDTAVTITAGTVGVFRALDGTTWVRYI